jgi:hypothetical protein
VDRPPRLEFIVTVTVCDGRLSATRSFTWTIKKR